AVHVGLALAAGAGEVDVHAGGVGGALALVGGSVAAADLGEDRLADGGPVGAHASLEETGLLEAELTLSALQVRGARDGLHRAIVERAVVERAVVERAVVERAVFERAVVER